MRTSHRATAELELKNILAVERTTKLLNDSGLGHLLRARAENPHTIDGEIEPNFLAASFANAERPDFQAFTEAFLARLTGPDNQTPRMWTTCKNSILTLLQTLDEFAKEDLRELDPWSKFLKLKPGGVWNALQKQGKGKSGLNHIATYLRKIVPEMVKLGYVPRSFEQDANGIVRLEVLPREPHIPSPAEMEILLSKLEDRDWELAQLPRALVYSGARLGAFLHPKKGLTWAKVDFDGHNITFTQKGDKRRRVPMGPQLYQLLQRWKEHTGGSGDERVFAFGSSKQDRLQEILKQVCGELGGPVRDMRHFHAFKHYCKTQHQRAGMPDDISDFLTSNVPKGRRESGAVYRHADYDVAREWVERVKL